MTQPDETILVSDGKTLWFYNPFVEQATATWLKDATGNTPFMLIARNQSSDWQQYNIKQNGDDLVLTPKASNGNLKQFTMAVTEVFLNKDMTHTVKAKFFGCTLLFFHVGVACSFAARTLIGPRSIFCALLPLCIALYTVCLANEWLPLAVTEGAGERS